jgi:hypothetical protein
MLDDCVAQRDLAISSHDDVVFPPHTKHGGGTDAAV